MIRARNASERDADRDSTRDGARPGERRARFESPTARARTREEEEVRRRERLAVVGTTRAHPLSDKSRPIVASLPFFASSAPLTATTAFPTAFPTATLVYHFRDRPKEVKCPRVVTETYKDARSGETRTRSYVRGRPLGKGGFAVVYSMQDPSTGESFAAKVVAKSTLEKDRARQKILTEIRIHRSVDNAHVVKFKRCFEDKDNVYILMELCSDKTLADVVQTIRARRRPPEPIRGALPIRRRSSKLPGFRSQRLSLRRARRYHRRQPQPGHRDPFRRPGLRRAPRRRPRTRTLVVIRAVSLVG